MKLVITSLFIALASSTVSAASPETASQLSTVAAPSAERIELARQFIAVSSPTDAMMDGVRHGFWLGAAEDLESIEDKAERSAAEVRLEQLLVQLEPRLREQMPDVLEAYAQVYATEFTTNELRQMIEFAQSEVGKHYLKRFPYLENDPSIFEAQQKLITEIAPIMDEFKKESCARRAAERLAAGDAKAKCKLSSEEDTRSS